ncbi:MAG: DNA repair protein RadC [Planctomycetes bacterium]|nr:DNA repair protein RadC [Planctomycetota bacterium]
MSRGPWSPRERAAAIGIDRLNDVELLAILIGTGVVGTDVAELAQQLEKRVGGIRALSRYEIAELLEFPGLGLAKATRLAAAVELGRRVCERRWEKGEPFTSSRRVFDHCHLRLRDERRERFLALYLDVRNRLVGEAEISTGSLVASVVHPREVFRPALSLSAASFVCVHNHPSGDPRWSPEDIAITQRLFDVGCLLGIELIDHIIVGDGAYTSFVDEGLPPFDAGRRPGGRIDCAVEGGFGGWSPRGEGNEQVFDTPGAS